jgi:hypothetical protein
MNRLRLPCVQCPDFVCFPRLTYCAPTSTADGGQRRRKADIDRPREYLPKRAKGKLQYTVLFILSSYIKRVYMRLVGSAIRRGRSISLKARAMLNCGNVVRHTGRTSQKRLALASWDAITSPFEYDFFVTVSC